MKPKMKIKLDFLLIFRRKKHLHKLYDVYNIVKNENKTISLYGEIIYIETK